MHYVLIPATPQIHTVPLPEITIGRAQISLLLDGADEQRHCFIFCPYQAIRVTTQDCFVRSPDSKLHKGGVFRVEDSLWLAELREALSHVDHCATFLDQAHHYIIPSGDDVVEVVAWEMKWDGSQGSGSYPDS